MALAVPTREAVQATAKDAARGRASGWFAFLKSDRSLLLGAVMCLSILILVLCGDLVIGLNPQQTGYDVLAAPSASHPLGTDSIGRDVMSRLILGARASLFVAVVATTITMMIGIFIGVTAGFFGGAVDWISMRIVDVFLSIPPLLMAIAILAAIGPSIPTLLMVLIVTYAPQVVRVVRAATLQAANRSFVDSARISGVNRFRIMWKHILPNVRGVLIVQATITVAHMLLVETVLSFLGMGVQPPAPSLGFMVSEGRQWMEIAPWTVLAPGSVIVLSIAAFTFLGQGLDAALSRRT